MTEPIGFCWSGGKDCALALAALSGRRDYEVVRLLTTVVAGEDRISMHGVRRALLHRQAESLGLPLCEVEIPPRPTNAVYEAKVGDALSRWRADGIRTVGFGDIFLQDVRDYRQCQLAAHGLRCLFPLWQRDTRELMAAFLADGFRAVTVCVDPSRLDKTFVGREIDAGFVAALPEGVDPCGENGEFHSFVYDGPPLSRRIGFSRGEVVERDSFLYCDLLSDCQPEPALVPAGG